MISTSKPAVRTWARHAAPLQDMSYAAQHRLWLGGAVALGAALRLIGLDRQSFWTDELYVVWEAKQPLALILDPQIHLQHPPGYRLALHAWMSAGLAETWLRLLPAFAGLFLIVVMWALARTLWPAHSAAAPVAALLAATSPYLLHYSQDVTTYSWTTLWVSGSFLLLLLARRSDRVWLWAAWAVSLAGALYSHYFSLFPLLVEGVAAVVLGFVAPSTNTSHSQGEIDHTEVNSFGRKRNKALIRAGLAMAGAALLYVPWAWTLLARGGEGLKFFYFPLTLDSQPLRWVPVLLAGYGNPLYWQFGAGRLVGWLIIGVPVLWGLWRLGKAWSFSKVAPVALVAAWGFAAIAGPYVFLRLSTPPEAVDPVRFATFAVPALLLALAAALVSMPLPARALAVAGWLLLAGVQWRGEVTSPPTQDWRGMLANVAQGAQPGDALFAFPALHAGSAASYYTVPMPVQGGWIVPEMGGAPDTGYWFPQGWRYKGFYNLDAHSSTDWTQELALRTVGVQRVWCLAGDGERDGTYPRSPTLEQAFAQEGFSQAGEWHASPLLLRLYVRVSR